MLESSRPIQPAAGGPRENEGPLTDEMRSLRRQLEVTSDQLEDREQRLIEAMETAQRQSEIMAMYAHDLRSPLAAIIGYADLLEMGVPETIPDCAQECVSRMREAAIQVQNLLDQVLTLRAASGTH